MHLNYADACAFYQQTARVLVDAGALVTVTVHTDWARENYELSPHDQESNTFIRISAESSVAVVEHHREWGQQALLAKAHGLKLAAVTTVKVPEDVAGLQERYEQRRGADIFQICRFQKEHNCE